MEQLIRYVAQFDPQFPQRIRGASAQEIARLEQLVGFPLPPTYRAFLEAMGQDMGGLELFVQDTSCISDVIEYYQRWVLTGQIKLPLNGIVFWFPDLPHHDLMLQSGDGNSEPRVYQIEDGEMRGPYADSLEQLLFQRAFVKYLLSPLPYKRWYSNERRTEQLQQTATLIRSLGAHIHTFSDSFTLCVESEGLALNFRFSQNSRGWGWLWAQYNPTSLNESVPILPNA